MTDDELDNLARSIANRIYKEVPEIEVGLEVRSWLQSLALDELNGLLKKKIKEENNDTTR
jgi:uncharacterized membrane protein YheB (UPF0754 family)